MTLMLMNVAMQYACDHIYKAINENGALSLVCCPVCTPSLICSQLPDAFCIFLDSAMHVKKVSTTS